MAITALPTPPLRTDPTNFAVRADAFLAALPTFVTEANATAAAMNLNATTDTSTSSVLIGTGSKSFTVSTAKSFQPGMWLLFADTAAPTVNSLVGQVSSYNSATGALVVDVPANGALGSGTKTAWTITLTAKPPADFVSVAMQPVASAATLAAARTALAALSTGYLQCRDEKSTSTAGGASAVGDQIRTLNTLVSNTITGASLATNQITLPAGTYRVRAHAPAFNVAAHQLRLTNVTDGTVVIRGTNAYTFTTVQTTSVVEGRFTLAAAKALCLTHYANQAVATNGLGVAIGVGAVENYATIEIWQE